MPRIIAGKARGIPLVAPHGQDTRPTSDKAKEALFSILAMRLPGARVLDLFSGTGQIGLEALSRGASEAVLVENSRDALQAIRTNLTKTRLGEGCRILPMEASKAVALLRQEGRPFDIVFLDPPYAIAAESLLRLAPLLSDGLLNADATVILEHDSRTEPPINVTNLQFARSCKYGTAMLSFYQYPTVKSPE